MRTKDLTIREKRLVKGIVEKGLTPKDSALLAGYSENTSDSYLYSTILKRQRIISALDKYGLNDKYIFKRLKKNTKVSKDEVVSVSDSNKAIELSLRLKGYLDNDKPINDNSNTNIYIKEIKQLSNEGLMNKLNDITKDIELLNSNIPL